MPSKDAMDKIRLKHAPKQYKRGPRPTGRARFVTRLAKLEIDLHRFAKKADTRDAVWAEMLAGWMHHFREE